MITSDHKSTTTKTTSKHLDELDGPDLVDEVLTNAKFKIAKLISEEDQAAEILHLYNAAIHDRGKLRHTFGKNKSYVPIPNLTELQMASYEHNFLQLHRRVEDRENIGLQSVIAAAFPVESANGKVTLEFVHYDLEPSKYSTIECKRRGLSYVAALKLTLRLIVWNIDEDTNVKEIREIKEQQVYIADIPLMTSSGTVIINGAERVIISQMHRSPGVFFDHDNGKTNSFGKLLYSASVIPYRGSWLDIEFDSKDLLYFRIDRKRKLSLIVLLKALGMTNQDILDHFYDKSIYHHGKFGWATSLVSDSFVTYKLKRDCIDADTGEVALPAGSRMTYRMAMQLEQSGSRKFVVEESRLSGQYAATDLISSDGVVILHAGDEITEENIVTIVQHSIKAVPVLSITQKTGPYIRNTLLQNKSLTHDTALYEIFRVMSPGEMSSERAPSIFFNNLFFDSLRYDLSRVGRVKLNSRLNLNTPITERCLTFEDIMSVIKTLIEIKGGIGIVDDIDNLNNRRARSIGELVENQFKIGMTRMAKAAQDRMLTVDVDSVMPYDLFNPNILISVLKEFFGTSALSQFMDQTNPLSEIAHKRRLSALGPGGLNRERAGFEVRDVHQTHYGRICPVETPEGQNIGLINSLATYAKINRYGFIETPYIRVRNGVSTDVAYYLSASEETKYKIAHANVRRDENGLITDSVVQCRHDGNTVTVPSHEVDFIDISSMQIVSIAAAMIPFLENDDANRALMGSNMQRQALPLLQPESPLVGTGVEGIVARDSGACIIAENDGVIEFVDSSRIIINNIDYTNRLLPSETTRVYSLNKFQRSNYSTCINQKPIVNVGDVIKKGDVITDGPSIVAGELALGRNVLVAFMPWYGCNFKDSILVSDRIVKEDFFTSIHIEEIELVARDTSLGPEEILHDVPGVDAVLRRHLDESGIVNVGSEVMPGDVLVGKITPKAESPMTPEEKLLSVILGDKSKNVSDTSLYVPPGISGTVIDVCIFSRKGISKSDRAVAIEMGHINQYVKDRDNQIKVQKSRLIKKLRDLITGQKVIVDEGAISSGAGRSATYHDTGLLNQNISDDDLLKVVVADEFVMSKINYERESFAASQQLIEQQFHERIAILKSGDDLPQGALEVVKVYIAMKRKLQPGDKMSGRHGNKGIVSRIVEEGDMPYLDDGTPVDIVLNSLGIPSRMNVGQILETHLGWAALNLSKKIVAHAAQVEAGTMDMAGLRSLVDKVYTNTVNRGVIDSFTDSQLLAYCKGLTQGVMFASPVFDGAKIEDIKNMLILGDQNPSGQVRLRDGKTGEYFDRDVTVGYKYMLRLHHSVDDKIHARSTGPYSLVTQQPLRGKSHFGGQRFGEMEVWALQGYGAAYVLQEMLTIKSDDVYGRGKMYSNIVNGNTHLEVGVPESFNVMIKEIRSLGLNIRLQNTISQSTNTDFDSLAINIASPEQIRLWSCGEVKKPETINYRTMKPERDGLFCAKIFGPMKDYECLCGKYRRKKYKGMICEKCGVEVTVASVRRERMGHIELAAPVAHIWFLKSIPSKIGVMLDLTTREVERILYFESHIVADPGISHFSKYALLTNGDFETAAFQYGEHAFTAITGAEAIRYLLQELDLLKLRNTLQQDLKTDLSEIKRKKIIKRLKMVDDFIESGNRPEWMILTVLPVIPPDIRPLVMLSSGKPASSDLNDLYRRVINRNNRLLRLIEVDAPKILLNNEKRMLQEVVDALFDNGKRGKTIKTANKRPLKSLGDMLTGKKGRIRLNLLGKRVDFSGRSVIVSGVGLKLHQCGIPKLMALELFKPFLYEALLREGLAINLTAAKNIVKKVETPIWDVLEGVLKGHPVLLNRAPTLHRLGIQAFEPLLIEGNAIQLHPLVCSVFNADFDGDQMAVHIPLSLAAQTEAKVLMMSTNNILSPAHGRPVIIPDEDVVLGIYYLTSSDETDAEEVDIYYNLHELYNALDNRRITIHTTIKYRVVESVSATGEINYDIFRTTPGRLILREILPPQLAISFEEINKAMGKKEVSVLIDMVYRNCGQEATVIFADELVSLGFQYASVAGISFGMDDMVIPETKSDFIRKTDSEIAQFEEQYLDGLITRREKHNKVIDSWTRCVDRVTQDMMYAMSRQYDVITPYGESAKSYNSIHLMVMSGARASSTQTKQLSGMKGLIVRPSGEIMPNPILSNFKEGLNVLEYFNSTPGARKGLSDVSLNTGKAGYFTRRLVDAAQDCTVVMNDCGVMDGLERTAVGYGEIAQPLKDSVLGRVSAVDVYHPIHKNQLVVAAGEMIDETIADMITDSHIDYMTVRSVVMCKAPNGNVCAKCYGRDLSNSKLVNIGEAVGVIAAQSIGEPGTQLTMRTFHIGGAATRNDDVYFVDAHFDGVLKFVNKNVVVNSEGISIIMSHTCEASIIDKDNRERTRYKIPYGARLVHFDHTIQKGMRIADWDPHTVNIITEQSGRVAFRDIVLGKSAKETVNEDTGVSTIIITAVATNDKRYNLRPSIELMHGDTIARLSNGLEARYYLPINAILAVNNGDNISAGDIIARLSRDAAKTRDIIGGLPRVMELFEARQPREHSIIADHDGTIEFAKTYKAKRQITLHPADKSIAPIEYVIPKNKHIMIADGDVVRRGDIIVDGLPLLQDILRVNGLKALVEHMTREIQAVYKLQGATIDDKHIEVLIRQMLQKVEILDSGDTIFLAGERVYEDDFNDINQKAIARGLKPATAQVIVHGITKASLQSRSFISAASFQETTKILTDSALAGKIDMLHGLKENVIVGRLIQAGTGLYVKQARQRAADMNSQDIAQEGAIDTINH